MDVSVIIPSYNTQNSIASCLHSLKNQETFMSHEIIVVDCSETDAVQKIVRRFEGIDLLRSEERFNPGKGRNIGAQRAQGDLLVFVDADVKVGPKSLQAACNHFTRGQNVFGAALELDEDATDNLAGYVEHYFFNHEAQAGRPMCGRNNLSSAFLCISRRLFLQEGGFKDIARMQDTELTERLRRRGHKLYFCPDVVGFQRHDSSLKTVLRKIYLNGQNLYFIRYKPRITRSKKIFFVAFLPLITLAKSGRIIGRHLRYQPAKKKLITAFLAVPLILSSMFWMIGFYRALITEQGISKSR